jgi:hypothetical protein
MVLTWPQHIKRIHKKNTYQLGRPICNPWCQCCCDKILLFWWNAHCRITITPKSNLICPFFLLLLSFFVCLWMMERVSIFLSLGYGHTNTRVTRILCLCSFTLVWLLRFNLKKKRRMIQRMKTYEMLKPWSLLFCL